MFLFISFLISLKEAELKHLIICFFFLPGEDLIRKTRWKMHQIYVYAYRNCYIFYTICPKKVLHFLTVELME